MIDLYIRVNSMHVDTDAMCTKLTENVCDTDIAVLVIYPCRLILRLHVTCVLDSVFFFFFWLRKTVINRVLAIGIDPANPTQLRPTAHAESANKIPAYSHSHA